MATYLSKAMAMSSTISTPAMTWMKKIWVMQPLKEMTLRFLKRSWIILGEMTEETPRSMKERLANRKYMGECKWRFIITVRMMREFPIMLATQKMEENTKRSWLSQKLVSPRNTNSDTVEWFAPSIALSAWMFPDKRKGKINENKNANKVQYCNDYTRNVMLWRLYIPSILSQDHIITKKAFHLCLLKAVESLSHATYLSPHPPELFIYKQEYGTNKIIDVHSKDWEGQERWCSVPQREKERGGDGICQNTFVLFFNCS